MERAPAAGSLWWPQQRHWRAAWSVAAMQYKDYYQTLGVARDASADDIKKAYRKLAREHHPDVSGNAASGEKFKEIGEAYATLKNAEKRAAYDALGQQPAGQEFRPPPGWDFGGARGAPGAGSADAQAFEDLDLADLFAQMGAARGGFQPRAEQPEPGEDFDTPVAVSLEDAFHGSTLHLDLSMPEPDEHGRLRHVTRTLEVRVPPGTVEGQKLRLRGRGGKGRNGGRDGDVYLHVTLKPHALFRASGHDLYLDLPLAPWEAVLGTEVEIPAPGGALLLTVPPGTRAGRKLRLAKRGLPRAGGTPGDILAVVQIDVPPHPNEREKELMAELAKASTFSPRAHFAKETAR
ncbi:J domain-containing protein [Xylophilus sp. GW821-FHT01B05]